MGKKGKGWLLLGGGMVLGAVLASRRREKTEEVPSPQAEAQADIRREMERLKQGYEKQDRMRRDFTANVSHELKTPLTSISGYAEILREGIVKQEDVGRFAGKIYEESQRLITLVEDILNLSLLDEGAPAQEAPGAVDLYQVCQETLATLGPAARRRGIGMSLSGRRHTVHGVEKILREIVYNLCDNAIKYNVEGGRMEVSVTREGSYVVLLVQDTGIGIPEGETDRVFERFYRVDKSHSKEIGGTGLGLSIVKHGAAYHNAQIRLDSQLGKGTRIWVRFPAGEEEKP
ncbi:MAG: ATP-binding protein [Evtepia sp.]|uniref:sensor histidine kinase n=1 Tax=Evtepia sp. TaxID=2773933 RepID=UPI002A753240|nr:ATP-binding protein [Evtepia sp.]MDY3014562.1 ATP-binding protein [Evtepia sp.]